MKIKKNMRKYVIALAAIMLPIMGTFAQTFSEPCIPTKEYTKSIDASVPMGTTGVGVDVAVPIGDVVKVKVLEVDRQGRVRLSIKEANAPTEAAAAPAAVAVEEPAAE